MCSVLLKDFVFCAEIQSTATVVEQPSQQQPASINTVDHSAPVPVCICGFCADKKYSYNVVFCKLLVQDRTKMQ